MSITSSVRLAGLVALLAVVAGCGTASQPVSVPPGGGTSGTPSEPAATGTPTAGESADASLVLRVDQTGGFVTPTMLATRLPMVSVYDDGRVITQGPQIAVWPAPALPNLLVRRVERAAVDELVTRARDAGVGDSPDVGTPPIADAPATRFTLVTEDGREVLEVPALMEADPRGGEAPGLTEEQLAARRQLQDLLAALTDLESTLGAEAVSDEEPYEPDAVAAVAQEWVPPGADLPGEPQEVPWPGPELPGEQLGQGLGLGCVTATGAEAEEVLAVAQGATEVTPWVDGGERWSVALRPLLPDESGCEDLFGQG